MHEPVYITHELQFEKSAGRTVQLNDNAEQWPMEVLSEAHRQLPFLSEFDAHVGFDAVDPQTGSGFGSLVLRPKTERTPAELSRHGLPVAHVIVVVREFKLLPLDVYAMGRTFKRLTETRIREELHRPDLFDASRDAPSSPSFLSDVSPPIESRGALGGAKLGSASYVANHIPLLERLDGTVRQEAIDRIHAAVSDPAIRLKLAHVPAAAAVFKTAAALRPRSDAVVGTAWSMLPPTVVQLRKEGSAFQYVTANHGLFAPSVETLSREQASTRFREQTIKTAETEGSITIGDGKASILDLGIDPFRQVNEFGLWRVQEVLGNDLVGWCFPNLVSFDMVPLPIVLFSNGSQYALQSDIQGAMLGKSTELPSAEIKGRGALYYTDGGNAQAIEPVIIRSSTSGPDGVRWYDAMTETGKLLKFAMMPNLRRILQTKEGRYIVPAQMKWLPLKSLTELVSDKSSLQKSASKLSTRGVLSGDGDVFSFSGPAFAHLPSEAKTMLKRADAMLLGCAAGVSPVLLKEAMSATCGYGRKPTHFENLRVVHDARQKLAGSRVSARRMIDTVNACVRPVDLTKEAAVIPDAMTVDKLLGLGMIHAENVATFVDMIPSFEAASAQIAELLIASRIGIQDVPEIALERAMMSLDDVITGLRRLRQRELTFREDT